MPPKKTTSTTSKLSFQSSKSSTKPKTKTELKAEEVLRDQEAVRVEKSREKGIVLDTIEFRDAYKIGKREMGVPTHPLDQVDVILSKPFLPPSSHYHLSAVLSNYIYILFQPFPSPRQWV
jgi:hypothetical protein